MHVLDPRSESAPQLLMDQKSKARASLGAKITAWFLGFAVLFDPYLKASETEGALKLTDLIGLMLIGALVIRLVTGYRYRVRFPSNFKLVLGLVAVWFAREWFVSGSIEGVEPIRWLLAVPYAYALYRLACNRSTRYVLAIGICWGAVANLAVVVLQVAGYEDLAVNLGLASGRWVDTWISSPEEISLRPTGMWGHPNATAGVIALCFPILCGLIDEGRLKPLWVVAGWLVVFVASALTFTRSGVVISCLLFLLWTLASFKTRRYLISKISLLVASVGGLMLIGPPGGWWRWLDQQNLSENSGDRMETTIRALELAFRNPLGIGAEYQGRLAAMTASGLEATHNAWLYLALVAGLPLALYMFFALTRQAVSLFSRSAIEGWLALQVIGLFFFEEFYRIPVFMIITLWLITAPRMEERSTHPVPLGKGDEVIARTFRPFRRKFAYGHDSRRQAFGSWK